MSSRTPGCQTKVHEDLLEPVFSRGVGGEKHEVYQLAQASPPECVWLCEEQRRCVSSTSMGDRDFCMLWQNTTVSRNRRPTRVEEAFVMTVATPLPAKTHTLDGLGKIRMYDDGEITYEGFQQKGNNVY